MIKKSRKWCFKIFWKCIFF